MFEKGYDIDDIDHFNYIDWLKKYKIEEVTLNSPLPHMPWYACSRIVT